MSCANHLHRARFLLTFLPAPGANAGIPDRLHPIVRRQWASSNARYLGRALSTGQDKRRAAIKPRDIFFQCRREPVITSGYFQHLRRQIIMRYSYHRRPQHLRCQPSAKPHRPDSINENHVKLLTIRPFHHLQYRRNLQPPRKSGELSVNRGYEIPPIFRRRRAARGSEYLHGQTAQFSESPKIPHQSTCGIIFVDAIRKHTDARRIARTCSPPLRKPIEQISFLVLMEEREMIWQQQRLL